MFTTITHNGVTFKVTGRQAGVLEKLSETNGGGFATVKGYRNSDGQVADYSFISRFSTENLYKRKRAALEAITAGQVLENLTGSEKVAALSAADFRDTFNQRKATLLESIDKSLSGERDDAHRQAHDRNYVTIAPGVKVNFVTEKVDGKQIPVKDADGHYTAGAIMLSIIQISKTVIHDVPRKVVNSGAPVLIGKEIERLLPSSAKIKTLSLKDDNFESLQIGGATLLPEAFKGL